MLFKVFNITTNKFCNRILGHHPQYISIIGQGFVLNILITASIYFISKYSFSTSSFILTLCVFVCMHVCKGKVVCLCTCGSQKITLYYHLLLPSILIFGNTLFLSQGPSMSAGLTGKRAPVICQSHFLSAEVDMHTDVPQLSMWVLEFELKPSCLNGGHLAHRAPTLSIESVNSATHTKVFISRFLSNQ